MKNLFRFLQFIAQFVTLGLAAAFVVTLFAPRWADHLRETVAPAPAQPATDPAAVPSVSSAPSQNSASAAQPVSEHNDGGPSSSYSHAVKKAARAVVSIVADKVEPQLQQQMLVPTDPRIREAIGGIPLGPPVTRSVSTRNIGSGVIVNGFGYALTNYHVIKDASNIKAVFPDGRVIKATTVGSDEETDLAVLQLDAYNTPTITVAETPPEVGDVVLAIGNPFGLDNTVTMGIVSALGRQLNPATGEEFIQTDAAINAGNSGGALVNTKGELVGISSNVYSPSVGGGSVGIGFAIPVARAQDVLNQIKGHGHVIRAWMGATYKDVEPRPDDPMPVVTNGATITAVESDSPAARAGLQPGDVVTRLDDKRVLNQFALRNLESHMKPGTKVSISGLRSGKPFQLDVVLEEKPSAQSAPPQSK